MGDIPATNLTNAHLFRLAGLSAVLAGTCYVLVGVFHPPNVFASASTTRWEIVHVIACAMCFFGLLGMVGLYARQAAKAGWMGLAGFLSLSSWFAIVMGFSFVEAFVLPHLVSVTPAFVHGWMGMFNGNASTVSLGALPTLWTLSGPIYILGGLLFGIATVRARILPRGAGILLAVGTVLAPSPVCSPSQPSRRSRCQWDSHWRGWDTRSGLNSRHRPHSPSNQRSRQPSESRLRISRRNVAAAGRQPR